MTDRIRSEPRNLDELYPVLHEARYTAGWHKARPSLWKEPATAFTPRHWRYAEARGFIDLAGEWIGTELAERRNLLMFNPVGDNDYASLPNVVAAYQMIKPGEHARAHRHTPNALRLVLSAGPEVYTVVDGVQLPMMDGDVVLTPGWTWHSHFNDGPDNAYWIDFLDVPLVHRLEPMFFEPHPEQFQAVEERPASSPMRFDVADQAARLEAAGELAPGCRRAELPAPSLRTIGLRVYGVDAGAAIPTRRSTANRLYALVKGEGRFVFDDERFDCREGDLVAAPIWSRHRFEAAADCRLLEVSDEPVYRLLGFHREEGAG